MKGVGLFLLWVFIVALTAFIVVGGASLINGVTLPEQIFKWFGLRLGG